MFLTILIRNFLTRGGKVGDMFYQNICYYIKVPISYYGFINYKETVMKNVQDQNPQKNQNPNLKNQTQINKDGTVDKKHSQEQQQQQSSGQVGKQTQMNQHDQHQNDKNNLQASSSAKKTSTHA